MSHTNSTPNYSLPQFVTTDKPFWLTDVNTAYADIDTQMKANADAAGTAGTNALQALADAATAGNTATSADNKANGIIASIADTFDPASTYTVGAVVIYNNLLYICTVAITVPGPWTGSDNWNRITLESIIDDKQNKMDNSLTTSNKTIPGAINEVNAKTIISDLPVNRVSGSITDAALRLVKVGNVVMLTGYFRTTANIADGSTLFNGFPIPYTPAAEGNMYFILNNETDNTVQRFRVNNIGDLKNKGPLGNGKTYVGTVTYICL